MPWRTVTAHREYCGALLMESPFLSPDTHGQEADEEGQEWRREEVEERRVQRKEEGERGVRGGSRKR